MRKLIRFIMRILYHPRKQAIVFTPVKYGLLYNWYAQNNPLKLSSSDDWIYFWQTPLAGYGAGACKETGTTYWQTPNTGATNANGLNLRGCGARSGVWGHFLQLNQFWFFRRAVVGDYGFAIYNSASWNTANGDDEYKLGFPQRFMRETANADETTGVYYGNDGKIYPTICWNGYEFMAADLAETKYRDGSDIPEVTSDAAWAALTTGALCAYNNDWSNV